MEAFAWRVKQRSPDIDPEVRELLLLRAAVLAASPAAATKKVCSAGCGQAKERAEFSGKQWAGRAVRRCVACVKACVEPKLCTHGKGAFDCAACIAIVKQEAEAEAAAAAEALVKEREPACVLEAEVDVEPEQHDANKKYTEAVVVAAKTCAEDAMGQTCYICTQALHWKTKEGLVRGCECRGTEGFAHLSCLAEQAKILIEDAEERDLGAKAFGERWARWLKCSLCEQQYHGIVLRALSWACWKTYVGRPEVDLSRRLAMSLVGDGLSQAKQCEEENAAAAADPSKKLPADLELEKIRAAYRREQAEAARQAVEKSPVFPELKTAIAEYANFSFRVHFPDPIRQVPGYDDIVFNTPEEDMLAVIKSQGLDRPAEGRANLLRRFREAVETDHERHQRDLVTQRAEIFRSLLERIGGANPGIKFQPYVKKMVAHATQEENRKRLQEKRIERRKCDVCPRAEEITAPRFLVCAGCKKKRYCSESCQEKDWLENGHKEQCMALSDLNCRVKPGCHFSERGYCDWCAETFCMDCEVGRIAPCANCGRFSCGSTQEHSYGPGGPCSAVTMCDTCGVSYCEECRDEYGAFGVLYCDACGTSYCEDCRPMAFCDICQNGFCCDDCRVVESCADCDTWFCADCDPVLKCNNCDKTICTKCSHGNEEIGIPHMCRDCERDAKALLRKELAKESGAYATLTARVAADEAGPWEARPWSFGERQALSLVVAGLPQPYLNEVFSIIGLGQTFPDGSFRVVDLPRGGFLRIAACIHLRPRASVHRRPGESRRRRGRGARRARGPRRSPRG